MLVRTARAHWCAPLSTMLAATTRRRVLHQAMYWPAPSQWAPQPSMGSDRAPPRGLTARAALPLPPGWAAPSTGGDHHLWLRAPVMRSIRPGTATPGLGSHTTTQRLSALLGFPHNHTASVCRHLDARFHTEPRRVQGLGFHRSRQGLSVTPEKAPNGLSHVTHGHSPGRHYTSRQAQDFCASWALACLPAAHAGTGPPAGPGWHWPASGSRLALACQHIHLPTGARLAPVHQHAQAGTGPPAGPGWFRPTRGSRLAPACQWIQAGSMRPTIQCRPNTPWNI